MKFFSGNNLVIVAFLLASATSADAAVRARVAHFAPFAQDLNATAVNVTLNGSPLLSGVKFGDFTDYLNLPGAGTYQIAVTPVGATTAAITQSVTVVDDTDYTIAAIGNGTLQPLELLAIADDNAAPPAGQLKLRVVHAAPFAADIDATRVSIRTGDGQVIAGLDSVPYKAYSDVLTLPAATYHVKVATPDGSTNLIDAAPIALPAGASLTVFAIGDGVNQPLGLTAIPVGALPLQAIVDFSTAGDWINLDAPGQGFLFAPVPSQDRLWGTWALYDANGNPTWYALDTCAAPGTTSCAQPLTFDGRHAKFAVSKFSGSPLKATPAGELDVDFQSCTSATANYINGTTNQQLTLLKLTPFQTCTITPASP